VITISKTGHQISDSDVIKAVKWDRQNKGYAGSVEYNFNGKTYLNPVTKAELDSLSAEKELVLTKHNGTY
jgi:hypothetical protein